MKVNDKDEYVINIRLKKRALQTQLSLGVGLGLIFLLAGSVSVKVFVGVAIGLDIISILLVMFNKGESTEKPKEEKTTVIKQETEQEETKVHRKPKPLERTVIPNDDFSDWDTFGDDL